MVALFQAAAEECSNCFLGVSASTWVNGIAAFGALGAAGAAWRSAVASRDAVEAQEDAMRAELISDLADEFWSDEFHSACEDLSDFFESEPGRWLERWERQVQRFRRFYERDTPSERIEDVNTARRRVKGYYHRIWQLTRASLLDVEQVREKLSPERNLPILFRAVEPLECAVTEDYDPEEKGELYRFFAEEVCPDEELYRPVSDEGCPSFSEEEGSEGSSA